MLTLAPDALVQKYGVTLENKTPLEVYEDICVKRGYLLKGGEKDYSRCALAVIDDFRKGRLGKVCLEGKTAL